MWREKICEAKKANNITTKMMSEKIHLPEPTIKRILSGKTETPRIDTVLDLGEAVGLSPWELFSESTAVLSDKNMILLQEQADKATATLTALQDAYAELSKEAAELRLKTVTLQAEVDMLQMQIKYKDEIIAVHDYYTTARRGSDGETR